ncbi:MAG: RdgB/HAM1 family non-canonical purine NTP pyrophosphatase [Acidiferrobacterales bacterium]|nr:RdgB/HAM1 family non-canonical purine NTP pyrophosphatase [Acidiferrobacterales bacterium]
MTKVVLATGNQGKVVEMQQSLQELGFEVLPQTEFDIPEAIEDGLSFVENAIKKARHACLHTRLPAIADDSGLEVDALQGAPGIYSARYAVESGDATDAANNQKLLRVLKAESNRSARFQCIIVYMRHFSDPTPIICQGTWEGEIAKAEAGDNGFGYDPLFYIREMNCHSAELEADTKKKISHRGQALAMLKNQLSNQL